MADARAFGWVLAGSVTAFVGGGILWFMGQSRSPYLDHDAALAAFANWCTPDGTVDSVAGDRYFGLVSSRYALMDAGVGLGLTGISVLLLAIVLFTTASDGSWLRTPKHRWTYLAVGVGIVAIGYVGIMQSLSADLSRMLFPPCSDSIIIPMAGLTMLTGILTPLLFLAGLLVTLGFGSLPVPLGQWDASRARRSWIVTIILGLLMSVILLAGISMAISSAALGAPATVVALYLLESTRSALLSPVMACMPEANA